MRVRSVLTGKGVGATCSDSCVGSEIDEQWTVGVGRTLQCEIPLSLSSQLSRRKVFLVCRHFQTKLSGLPFTGARSLF